MSGDRDTILMRAALDAAREALARGDMPIGAVVVIDGRIVATGANAVDSSRDDTRHAELTAIEQCATKLFAAKRRQRVELFTTMEPCAMCFGAIAHFRINRVVTAMDESIAGVIDVFHGHPFYDRRGMEWIRGVLGQEACQLFDEYQSKTGHRQHIQSVRHADEYRIELIERA